MLNTARANIAAALTPTWVMNLTLLTAMIIRSWLLVTIVLTISIVAGLRLTVMLAGESQKLKMALAASPVASLAEMQHAFGDGKPAQTAPGGWPQDAFAAMMDDAWNTHDDGCTVCGPDAAKASPVPVSLVKNVAVTTVRGGDRMTDGIL